MTIQKMCDCNQGRLPCSCKPVAQDNSEARQTFFGCVYRNAQSSPAEIGRLYAHQVHDQKQLTTEVVKLMDSAFTVAMAESKDLRIQLEEQHLRADTAEAENRILRHSNASYLETVAKVCDMLGIDLDAAKHADGKPSDVLFFHAKSLAEKLAAAEQRIAELIGLLRQSKKAVDDVAENCEDQRDWLDASSMRALSLRIDAAINQKSEAICRDHHYQLGECTKCGAISATE